MTSKEFFNNIVKNEYCVGCGVCGHGLQDKIKFDLIEKNHYLPAISDKSTTKDRNKLYENIKKYCPYSTKSLNEDQISKIIFKKESLKKDPYIGSYKNIYLGHSDNRKLSSSGGGVYEYLSLLLKKNLVEAILHVRPVKNSDIKFDYLFSENLKELSLGRGSFYYPVTLGNKINEIYKYKSIAIVGLPCFIKSINNLILHKPELSKIIKYKVGIVCGHLKTSQFTDFLNWQINKKKLDTVDTVNYRFKYSGINKANNYAVKISNNGQHRFKKNNDLFGFDWGYGLFKLKGCDFCDDIFAETADIVFGDAWLDRYLDDGLGTNIVVTRTNSAERIMKIIQKKDKNKYVKGKTDDAHNSQMAGIKHRKIGIHHRIKYQKLKSWVPKKRSLNNFNHYEIDQNKSILRYKISEFSRTRFNEISTKKDIFLFVFDLLKFMDPYFLIYKSPKYKFLPNFIYLFFKKIKILNKFL